MTGCFAVVDRCICSHVLCTIHSRFGRSVGEVTVQVVEVLLHGIPIEKEGCGLRQVSRQASHSWILRFGGGCGFLLPRVFSLHAANPLLTVIRQIQQSPSESLTLILELCQNMLRKHVLETLHTLKRSAENREEKAPCLTEAASPCWAGLTQFLQRGRIYSQLEVWFKHRGFSGWGVNKKDAGFNFPPQNGLFQQMGTLIKQIIILW